MQNCMIELNHNIAKDCNLIHNHNPKYETYLKSDFYFDFIGSEIDSYFWKSKYILELLLHTPSQLFEGGFLFGDDQTSLLSVEKLNPEYQVHELRELLTVDNEAKFDYNYTNFISWLCYIKPASEFIAEGELVNLLAVEGESDETRFKRVIMNLAILTIYSRSFQESEIEQILVILIYCFDDMFTIKRHEVDFMDDYKEDAAFFLFYALIYKSFSYQVDSLSHFISSFQTFQKFFPEVTIIGYSATVEMCLENVRLRNLSVSSNALIVVGDEKFLDNDLYKVIMALRKKYPIRSLKQRLIQFIKTYYESTLLPNFPSIEVPTSKFEAKLQIIKYENEILSYKQKLADALEKNKQLESRSVNPQSVVPASAQSTKLSRREFLDPELLWESEAKDKLIQLKDRKIKSLKEALKQSYEQQMYLYNRGRLVRKKGEFLLSEERSFRSFMKLLGASDKIEADDEDPDLELIIKIDPEVETSYCRSLSYSSNRISQNVYKYYLNNQNEIFKNDNDMKSELLKLGVYLGEYGDETEVLYKSEIEGMPLRKLEREILLKENLRSFSALQQKLESYKNSETHKEISKLSELIPEMNVERNFPLQPNDAVGDLLKDIEVSKLDEGDKYDDDALKKQKEMFWDVATELCVSNTPSAPAPSKLGASIQNGNDEVGPEVVTKQTVDTESNLARSNDMIDLSTDSLTTKNVQASHVGELKEGEVVINERAGDEEHMGNFKRQKIA